MIPFFRKTRKKMADDNKPLKYMRYAVGEIALVVIGILIALQINNWNEERKLKVERLQNIISLHDDLAKDTLLINERIEYLRKSYEYISSLENRAFGMESNLDTVLFISLKQYNPGIQTIRNFNSTTFNSLESSGKLELLNNELKTLILTHYFKQKRTSELLEVTLNSYMRLLLEYNMKYKLGQVEKQTYLGKLAWSVKDEKNFVMSFNSVLGYHRHALNIQKMNYESLLTSTIELMTFINADE